MNNRSQPLRVRAGLALAAALFTMKSVSADTLPKEPIQVGMPKSMVTGVPEIFVDILGERLGVLMKEFTGMDGKLQVGGSAYDVAKKLDDAQVKLGVFQGVEFAWVRARHPDLKPLMLLLSSATKVHAQMVVRKDSGVAKIADLRGKGIACPKKSKVHCHIFLEGACARAGERDPKAFFGAVQRPGTAEMALNDLVAGKCDAVLVDQVEVEFYRRLKPGDFSGLQVLETSEAFPAAVIAYREGALSAAAVERFRTGMLKANKSERGQDIMNMWHITSFEPVHEGYLRHLDEIVRVYPAGESLLSLRK
jgi:ABC-type phosphate/phosphonate transport system substrate-binding protein